MWIILGIAAIGVLMVAGSNAADSRRRTLVGESRLGAVEPANICITHGAWQPSRAGRLAVNVPTFRAVARGTSGDAAELSFTFKGQSPKTRALGSGQIRRQIGLKLRAENGCNLVYVMWRFDPSPQIEVSVKINPGARVHRECGTNGYSKIHATQASQVTGPTVDSTHTLRAEIVGDELFVWLDGKPVWRGALPATARTLAGPVGFRSDNVAYTSVSLYAAPGQTRGDAGCVDSED